MFSATSATEKMLYFQFYECKSSRRKDILPFQLILKNFKNLILLIIRRKRMEV